jgi:hypothetical protein
MIQSTLSQAGFLKNDDLLDVAPFWQGEFAEAYGSAR